MEDNLLPRDNRPQDTWENHAHEMSTSPQLRLPLELTYSQQRYQNIQAASYQKQKNLHAMNKLTTDKMQAYVDLSETTMRSSGLSIPLQSTTTDKRRFPGNEGLSSHPVYQIFGASPTSHRILRRNSANSLDQTSTRQDHNVAGLSLSGAYPTPVNTFSQASFLTSRLPTANHSLRITSGGTAFDHVRLPKIVAVHSLSQEELALLQRAGNNSNVARHSISSDGSCAQRGALTLSKEIPRGSKEIPHVSSQDYQHSLVAPQISRENRLVYQKTNHISRENFHVSKEDQNTLQSKKPSRLSREDSHVPKESVLATRGSFQQSKSSDQTSTEKLHITKDIPQTVIDTFQCSMKLPQGAVGNYQVSAPQTVTKTAMVNNKIFQAGGEDSLKSISANQVSTERPQESQAFMNAPQVSNEGCSESTENLKIALNKLPEVDSLLTKTARVTSKPSTSGKTTSPLKSENSFSLSKKCSYVSKTANQVPAKRLDGCSLNHLDENEPATNMEAKERRLGLPKVQPSQQNQCCSLASEESAEVVFTDKAKNTLSVLIAGTTMQKETSKAMEPRRSTSLGPTETSSSPSSKELERNNQNHGAFGKEEPVRKKNILKQNSETALSHSVAITIGEVGKLSRSSPTKCDLLHKQRLLALWKKTDQLQDMISKEPSSKKKRKLIKFLGVLREKIKLLKQNSVKERNKNDAHFTKRSKQSTADKNKDALRSSNDDKSVVTFTLKDVKRTSATETGRKHFTDCESNAFAHDKMKYIKDCENAVKTNLKQHKATDNAKRSMEGRKDVDVGSDARKLTSKTKNDVHERQKITKPKAPSVDRTAGIHENKFKEQAFDGGRRKIQTEREIKITIRKSRTLLDESSANYKEKDSTRNLFEELSHKLKAMERSTAPDLFGKETSRGNAVAIEANGVGMEVNEGSIKVSERGIKANGEDIEGNGKGYNASKKGTHVTAESIKYRRGIDVSGRGVKTNGDRAEGNGGSTESIVADGGSTNSDGGGIVTYGKGADSNGRTKNTIDSTLLKLPCKNSNGASLDRINLQNRRQDDARCQFINKNVDKRKERNTFTNVGVKKTKASRESPKALLQPRETAVTHDVSEPRDTSIDKTKTRQSLSLLCHASNSNSSAKDGKLNFSRNSASKASPFKFAHLAHKVREYHADPLRMGFMDGEDKSSSKRAENNISIEISHKEEPSSNRKRDLGPEGRKWEMDIKKPRKSAPRKILKTVKEEKMKMKKTGFMKIKREQVNEDFGTDKKSLDNFDVFTGHSQINSREDIQGCTLKSIVNPTLVQDEHRVRCERVRSHSVYNTVTPAIYTDPTEDQTNSLKFHNLEGIVKSGRVLQDTNLRGTILRDTKLRDTSLHNTNLCDTILRDTNLQDTNLRDTYLRDKQSVGLDLCDTRVEKEQRNYPPPHKELRIKKPAAHVMDRVSDQLRCSPDLSYPVFDDLDQRLQQRDVTISNLHRKREKLLEDLRKISTGDARIV